MLKEQKRAPEGVIFFSGYHGVGKTYTATAMLESFNARIIDCGPTIRTLFGESGFNSFDGWVKNMEQRFGQKWDDELLLSAIKDRISSEELLFIVGNRDIETILFLSERLPHRKPPLVIYLEKPISVIKCGYELRTKAILTDEEFETILHSGPDKKLDSVRQYVIEHPECCKLIYEEAYSSNSIEEAIAFVKEKYQ
ncbi:hypothetical protein IKF20_00010 [Candidatus Saccharibacteria bacterium]|nr:hypothetical protein [Candidatus Saccharibacteria bacterium]